jgi:hypothetical protein
MKRCFERAMLAKHRTFFYLNLFLRYLLWKNLPHNPNFAQFFNFFKKDFSYEQ